MGIYIDIYIDEEEKKRKKERELNVKEQHEN